MLVGSAVGGGYDAYARFVSRHLGRFIPGNPTFVVQNMPGAAGAVAAGNLYNIAAKDGTAMEMFQREILVAPLLESRNIENRYDARKFNWLGSLNSETGVIVVRGTTPHKTFNDLLTKEIIAGSTGPSSDFLTIAMNRVLKTKFKLVGGYRSSTEVYLAMERGEVEARVSNGWSGDKGIVAPWVRDGKARLLVALTLKKSHDLPELPLITDFVKDPYRPADAGADPLRRPVGPPVRASARRAEGSRRGAAQSLHRHDERPGIPRRGAKARPRSRHDGRRADRRGACQSLRLIVRDHRGRAPGNWRELAGLRRLRS